MQHVITFITFVQLGVVGTRPACFLLLHTDMSFLSLAQLGMLF